MSNVLAIAMWFRKNLTSNVRSANKYTSQINTYVNKRYKTQQEQVQWRRNVSQWDGSSRPTFKSGTARNAFCRPTFWPQTSITQWKRFLTMNEQQLQHIYICN